MKQSRRAVARQAVAVVLGLFLVGALWGAKEAAYLYAAPAFQRATPTFTPTPPPTAAPPTPTPTVQAPTATPTEAPPAAPTSTPPSAPPTATPDSGGAPGDKGEPEPPPPGCTIRVEGFVLDTQGRPLPNVLVRLRGAGWSAEWYTDTNGFFYFDGLCTGDAVVEAIMGGQVIARQAVRLEENTPTVQVTLRTGVSAQPTATTMPGTPTVTATATATPVPVPTATPQVVQRLPQTGSNMLPYLLVAGVLAAVMLGVRAIRQLSAH